METNLAEKVKGWISYPCCPKEAVMVFENSHGKSSIKCPRCEKFSIFDFDTMTATLSKPARGAKKGIMSVKNSGK